MVGQVAWNDESNPAQGFKYLYLNEEDYTALEEGTVNAKEVVEGGEKRFALTDIIGQVRGCAGVKSCLRPASPRIARSDQWGPDL